MTPPAATQLSPPATTQLSEVVSTTPTAAATSQTLRDVECVRVKYVAASSPAAHGGLRRGDIISLVNGRPAMAVLLQSVRTPLLARGEHVYTCWRLPESHAQPAGSCATEIQR